MICPKCASENRESAKFCDECGAVLEKPSEQQEIVEEETSHEVDGFDFSAIDEEEPTEVLDIRGIDEMVEDPTAHDSEDLWGSGSGDTMKMPRIEGQDTEKKKEFKAPDESDKKRPNKVRRAVIGVFVALAVLIGGLGLTLVIDLPDGTNVADAIGLGKFFGGTKVPDVTGLDKDEATQILEEKGFKVRATQIKSDENDDIVMLMDPENGSRLPEGETIVLHVAIARSVPDVTGKSLEEAQNAFEEEGLTNIKIEKEKSNEKEDTVLSIVPEKGTKLTAATEVVVRVAEAYVVPDVLGMDRASAVEKLNAEGYEAYVVYVYDEGTENTVAYTDPQPGSKLNTGSTVTVAVLKSRASELTDAANIYFAPGNTITIGGSTYRVGSCDAVEYLGEETTICTITAALVVFDYDEEIVGSFKTRTFTVVWDSSNQVISIG